MQKIITLALGTLVLFSSADAYSQSPSGDGHKFEVGAQFSVLNNSVVNEIDTRVVLCTRAPCPPFGNGLSKSGKTQLGLGGRFGYNLTDDIAIEAELNFFPKADLFSHADYLGINNAFGFNDGKLIEGLFGLKAGKRLKKVGIFGKARPGFLYASKGDLEHRQVGCILIYPPPAGCYQTKSKNSFALDLGGVVELYPAKRTIIRFDVGDTIVRLGVRNATAVFIPSFPSQTPMVGVGIGVPAETTHNFQASVGVGFRF